MVELPDYWVVDKLKVYRKISSDHNSIRLSNYKYEKA